MRARRRRNKIWIAWLMVLPVLIIRGFTAIYPFITTFRNSFYNINLLRGEDGFIGIQNYFNVFHDRKVIMSLEFTVEFVVLSMLGHVIFGVMLALVLNMRTRWKRFLRTIVLIPWAMPAVVSSLAAKWAFNDKYGLINDLVRRFNPDFSLNWLIHTDTARIAVILVDIWKSTPYFAILVLAGLQFISYDIYEAAKVDGASQIQTFFRITLPLILKTILTMCIPFTMGRLTMYTLSFAMTGGGPSDSTALIAYRITTEAFTNLNIGYASVLAILLFGVMIIFSMLNLRVIRKLEN